MLNRILLLTAVAIPAVSFAGPIWSSDFESGLTGWTSVQAVNEDRVQLVSDPVRQGRRALKVTVHQGDDPIRSGNDRAELVYMTHEAPGSEYFYRWSVMFAPDYPSSPKWQLFTQWHQDGLSGTPPLEIYVVGEEMRLRAGGHEGPVLWRAPLRRGVWQDFVLHVKWSSNPEVGFVELFHDGRLAMPRTAAPTMLPGQLNYLKMGLYRSREIAPTGVVYLDDVRMGLSLGDVSEGGELVDDPAGTTDGLPDDYESNPPAVGCAATGAIAPIVLALAAMVLLRRARAPMPIRSRRWGDFLQRK